MTADQKRWASMRGNLLKSGWRIRSECKNLDADGKCKIYDNRPDVCREYETGGEMCKAARRAYKDQLKREENYEKKEA
jgi:Fe-S-cluster containining protein